MSASSALAAFSTNPYWASCKACGDVGHRAAVIGGGRVCYATDGSVTCEYRGEPVPEDVQLKWDPEHKLDQDTRF